ncbi:MAG: hypothetical protein HY071_04445 [Chloroflexi bacterium]|nr:hypothetical protein [Chloroflexota bacterium]
MPATPPSASAGVDIEAVIEAVKKQIKDAAGAAPHLELKEFDLELSVTVKKEASGGFSFTIPIFGKISLSDGLATENVTKLELTYKAPEAVRGFAVQSIDPKGLATALSTIEKSIHAGEVSEPRLPLSEGAISFAFGVTFEAGGKVEILILEAGVKGSREDTHTITLKFSPRAGGAVR